MPVSKQRKPKGTKVGKRAKQEKAGIMKRVVTRNIVDTVVDWTLVGLMDLKNNFDLVINNDMLKEEASLGYYARTLNSINRGISELVEVLLERALNVGTVSLDGKKIGIKLILSEEDITKIRTKIDNALFILADEVVKGYAEQFAYYAVHNNIGLGDFENIGGMGQALLHRAMLLIDARYTLSLGLDFNFPIILNSSLFSSSNKKLMLKEFISHLDIILREQALERESYNVTSDEVILDNDSNKLVLALAGVDSVELEKVKSEIAKTPIKYIDDYRVLSKMVLDKGFEHIRDNGDHGIFKHESSGQVIVVPQGRKIGRGLSIKIQKDLQGISI